MEQELRTIAHLQDAANNVALYHSSRQNELDRISHTHDHGHVRSHTGDPAYHSTVLYAQPVGAKSASGAAVEEHKAQPPSVESAGQNVQAAETPVSASSTSQGPSTTDSAQNARNDEGVHQTMRSISRSRVILSSANRANNRYSPSTSKTMVSTPYSQRSSNSMSTSSGGSGSLDSLGRSSTYTPYSPHGSRLTSYTPYNTAKRGTPRSNGKGTPTFFDELGSDNDY